MSDTTTLDRVQADHELRIRNLETLLNGVDSTLRQMVTNTDDIKERISCLSQGTATQDHIIRVESMVSSAHKRLDEFNKEFWKIRAEHDSCLRVKDETTESISELKDRVADLKLDLSSISSAVGGLKDSKDENSNTVSDIKDTVSDLKLNLSGVSTAVEGLKNDKNALTSFFSTRVGAIVDRIIQFVPWIVFWLYVERQTHAAKVLTGG